PHSWWIPPFPERERYGYERLSRKEGFAIFMFSRGCPFSCTYCCNHAIARTYNLHSNKPRYRSPGRSVEEIKLLREKFPFERVFICDDTFGLNKDWTREFCERYAAEVGIPLVCQLRVNIVTDELMRHLKRANCVHVSCGVESGNDYIRNKVMRRNISERQIVDAYALFKRYGIASNAINLIGLPHETTAAIWDTIRLNRKIRPDSSGVNIFYPYRGTQLGDYCFEEGLVDEEEYLRFSSERRDSVLNFPPEFKRELRDFHAGWETLAFKYRPVKLARTLATKFVKPRYPRLWEGLRSVKRIIRPGRR
ncbi:B12-binding domain-containing radical SAM protein, partial [Elusimicrobiota bacterium]